MPGNAGDTADVPSYDGDFRPFSYFEAAYGSFQAAEHRSGENISHFYRIANRTVRLRFAGPALVPRLTPALAHLTTPPTDSPDLTICLWDSASTHIAPPEAPWRLRDQFPGGSIRGYNSERFRTATQGEPEAVSVLDRALGLAVYWTCAADQIPSHEMASPLHVILHWSLDHAGFQFVHAGAVGTERSAILLTGKGGSGKSTTAVACLEYGLTYLGDNFVFLSTRPVPYVWSLYNSTKLNADSLERLPYLSSVVRNPNRPEGEKALVFLQDRYPGRLVASLPVSAIILPQITESLETRLVRSSRAAALFALAPTSIFQLPDADQYAFRTMADFAKQVPCYTLEIGRNSSKIPQLISDLLEKIGHSSHDDFLGIGIRQ